MLARQDSIGLINLPVPASPGTDSESQACQDRKALDRKRTLGRRGRRSVLAILRQMNHRVYRFGLWGAAADESSASQAHGRQQHAVKPHASRERGAGQGRPSDGVTEMYSGASFVGCQKLLLYWAFKRLFQDTYKPVYYCILHINFFSQIMGMPGHTGAYPCRCPCTQRQLLCL